MSDLEKYIPLYMFVAVILEIIAFFFEGKIERKISATRVMMITCFCVIWFKLQMIQGMLQ